MFSEYTGTAQVSNSYTLRTPEVDDIFSKLSRAETFRMISTLTALKKSDRIAINIIGTIVERYAEDS